MFNKHTVADVMTRDVCTVVEEDNLERVMTVLRPYRFRHVPVVDGKRVVGILSHRDLLQMVSDILVGDVRAHLGVQRRLAETFVRDLMTQNVVTIHGDASVRQAARTMREHRLGALPVVDMQGALIGMVSESDLVSSMAASG